MNRPGITSRTVLGRWLSLFFLVADGGLAATLTSGLVSNQLPANTCTPPPTATTIRTSDPYITVWFSASNIVTGDSVSVEWYAPDGRLNGTPSQYQFPNPTGCFWAYRTLSSSYNQFAGLWRVRVIFNGVLFFERTFTLVVPVTRNERILNSLILTRNPQTDACATPQPVTGFLETDATMSIWYAFSNGYAGDVTSVEWRDPNGRLVRTTTTNPLPADGNYCSSSGIPLDASTSRQFGNWTAKATYNGREFFTATVPLNDSRYFNVPFRLDLNQWDFSQCPNNTLVVSVTDRYGNSVSGLTSSDFSLLEGGVAVPVQAASVQQVARELSLAIVIDSSSSLTNSDLSLEKAAAKQLIGMMPARDAIAVYSFTQAVVLQQTFTTDHNAALSGVDRISDRGGTAIYDAIIRAAADLGSRNSRRAIVLMTDGEDTSSSGDQAASITGARQAGVPVFTVGFGAGKDPVVLTQIAEQTGAFYSSTSNSPDLQRILFALGSVLTNQYQLSYNSANPSVVQQIALQVNTSSGRSNPYTLTGIQPCAGGGAAATITNFTASPDTIALGQSSTLNWSVSNATSVSIDPGIGSVPSSGTRPVTPAATTAYVLTAASANGQTTTRTVTVTVTGGTAPSGSSPVITSVNTADGGPDIAQNTWIVVKGNNLAPPSTPASGLLWNSAPEFASGRMPTQLGSVSVRVNGRPAYIYFVCSARTNPSCSSDQINALSPLDSQAGPVDVVVTNGPNSSAPFMLVKKSTVPSFLLWDKYVVATHSDLSLVGPPALFAGRTRPAESGETVTLWAVGFGLPSTPLVDGSSSQRGDLPIMPSVQVGGRPARVSFAGVVSPGLYQINVEVPTGITNGDNEIRATYDGITTPPGRLLTITGGASNPPPLPDPVISQFLASVTARPLGQPITLSWSTQNATSVQLSSGVGNPGNPVSVQLNGSATVTPSQAGVWTYRLAASNGRVTVSRDVIVTVTGGPSILTLKAPAFVKSGDTADVEYATQNATLVTLRTANGTVVASSAASSGIFSFRVLQTISLVLVAENTSTPGLTASQNVMISSGLRTCAPYAPPAFDGRAVRPAFRNDGGAPVEVRLYHPSDPTRPFSTIAVGPGQNALLTDSAVGNDWGMRVNDFCPLPVGSVSLYYPNQNWQATGNAFSNFTIFPSATLSLSIQSRNPGTRSVVINGIDTARPAVPFTFDWGDGTFSVGFFPQSKTYAAPGFYRVIVIGAYGTSNGYAAIDVVF